MTSMRQEGMDNISSLYDLLIDQLKEKQQKRLNILLIRSL